METISKKSLSTPLLLGVLLETLTIPGYAYTTMHDTNSDLIMSAANALAYSHTQNQTPTNNHSVPHTTENSTTDTLNKVNTKHKYARSQHTRSLTPPKIRAQHYPEKSYPETPAYTAKKPVPITHNTGSTLPRQVRANPGNPSGVAPIVLSQAASSEVKKMNGYVEAGLRYFDVTNDQGNWNDQYLLGVVQTDAHNIWDYTIERDNRFHEKGTYAVVGDTHIINEDWYTHVSAGMSDSSTVVPKYLIGGTVFKKQGPQKKIVGYLGANAYWWRTGHTTQEINPGFIYYFDTPWTLEGGALITRDNPGRVYAAYGYTALTQGTEKDHYYIARLGFGKEAYQFGDIIPEQVGYPSYTITGTWRKWLGKNWGFNLVGEYYHNRFYQRTGGSYGMFIDFG